MNRLRQLIHEIHRRSLWQVLLIYVGASWAVLQVVDTVAGALQLPDWLEPVALVLLVVGLPIVLATAFVQEGVGAKETHRTPEPTEAAPAVNLFTWRNAFGGGVLAFALWGVVAAGWVLTGGTRAVGTEATTLERSVAVLPFVNMSGNPENEYFSDGITEELLNALAQLPDLRVPARTSSFAFKGRNLPITEIAQELNVANILEGSVRRAGDRVLITAQLVDAESDTHMWSESYERDLVDIFSIQREIADAIADQLDVTLSGGATDRADAVATSSAEAYDLYLRGREYWDRPNWFRENFEAAIELFERAVELDPEFALARAALSVAHSGMVWPGYNGYDRSPERIEAATLQAREALRLQPNLAEAHLAMGYVHYWCNYDLEAGLREFEIAQRLAPQDVEIMEARGFVHRRLGNWAEVERIFRDATALSPRDPNLFQNLGGVSHMRTGHYEDAISALTRAVELAPDQAGWRVQLAESFFFARGELDSLRVLAPRLDSDDMRRGVEVDLALLERDPESLRRLLGEGSLGGLDAVVAYRILGDEAAARGFADSVRVEFERQLAEDPENAGSMANLGLAYAVLGRAQDARAMAEPVAASSPDDAMGEIVAVLNAAIILAQAGLADEAVDLLVELQDTPYQTTAHALRLSPVWDPIREHPRFQALIESRQ